MQRLDVLPALVSAPATAPAQAAGRAYVSMLPAGDYRLRMTPSNSDYDVLPLHDRD